MRSTDTHTLVNGFTADAKSKQRLPPVVEIILATNFYCIPQLIWNISRFLQHGYRSLYRFPLRFCMI